MITLNTFREKRKLFFAKNGKISKASQKNKLKPTTRFHNTIFLPNKNSRQTYQKRLLNSKLPTAQNSRSGNKADKLRADTN